MYRVGGQLLGKLWNRLLDVFLEQLFLGGLYGNFQLINCHVRLLLEFILLFQHDAPVVIVQQVGIWRVSMKWEQFTRSQYCMTLETLRNWGLCLLKQHNFVTFRYI